MPHSARRPSAYRVLRRRLRRGTHAPAQNDESALAAITSTPAFAVPTPPDTRIGETICPISTISIAMTTNTTVTASQVTAAGRDGRRRAAHRGEAARIGSRRPADGHVRGGR